MNDNSSVPIDYTDIAKSCKTFAESSPGGCTEENITEIVKINANLFKIPEYDVQRVIDLTLELTQHTLSSGFALVRDKANHVNWYYSRKASLDMPLTDRYMTYLSKDIGLSSQVIDKLDSCTDEIMNYFGDPTRGVFSRKGLVMGDVQSGKTNTYMMLANKAADADYKVIIILTSNIETLRKQTQYRVDASVIGNDSDAMLTASSCIKIGVGKIDRDPVVNPFTSAFSDFSIKTATANGFQVRDQNASPCLLVIKKNKDILNNLNNWLKKINTVADEKINQSMLLIDDEADYASVNTSRSDASKINKSIRTLLNLFTRVTYCGFTATPFANIYIDPDDHDDLFPRDFIYCLGSSDNYIGPNKIFSADESDDALPDYPRMLQTIRYKRTSDKKLKKYEGLDELKLKHNKDDILQGMPISLREAILEFILSCAIRDLRGKSKSHMSMLINMSRFTNVQENIRKVVDAEFRSVSNSIKVYSGLSEEEAMKDSNLRDLKRVFDDQYYDCEYRWSRIQHRLKAAVAPIIVRTVNQNNGAENIDYKNSPDGMRIIAIGGDSLSRGLTLEGLCISYFYRQSSTYDTLMQMGRWFGYRDGYADLCRVWMTEESIEWYTYINRATEKLKDQFFIMCNRNRDPSNFGFLVENDLATLQITGRSKMYFAPDAREIAISVSGKMLNTIYFYADPVNASENIHLVEEVLTRVRDEKNIIPWQNKSTGNYVWRNVPKEYVQYLIENYQNPYSNDEFDTEVIDRFLKEEKDCLKEWDVAIISRKKKEGTLDKYRILDIEINRPSRTVVTPILDEDPNNIGDRRRSDRTVLKFTKGMLITATDMGEGLYQIDSNGNLMLDANGEPTFDSERRDNLGKEYLMATRRDDKDKSRTPPAIAYLNTAMRNPILLIYLIDLTGENKVPSEEVKPIIDALGDTPPVCLAIGFPMVEELGDATAKFKLKYRPNKIFERYGGYYPIEEGDE